MAIDEIHIDPHRLGLPDRDELVEMRIWDSHYHGTRRHGQVWPYFQRMGVERVFSLDVCPMIDDAEQREQRIQEDTEFIAEHEDHLSGLTRVNDPGDVDATLEHLKRTIEDGPCIGMKTGSPHPADTPFDDPSYDPIVEYLGELGAVIYVHTGLKTTQVGDVEDERNYTDGMPPGEATPMQVANMARRFPDIPIICGHQGMMWELGIRAVRGTPNVLLEFSGMNPERGASEFAVKELGAERIVWGCHAASRGFANELSKIYDADITRRQRQLIFGENLRRISKDIHERKGIAVEV